MSLRIYKIKLKIKTEFKKNIFVLIDTRIYCRKVDNRADSKNSVLKTKSPVIIIINYRQLLETNPVTNKSNRHF